MGALALLGATSLVSAPASAQQASYGQYLVVLDDSGSMDATDPRRLVVLAGHALAAALEDGDQIMLVGLNELARGAPAAFRSPRELLEGRDGSEGERALSTPLAEQLGRHAGATPCRAALEHATQILESVAGAGAPQTVLFLSDGACNGGATETPTRFLEGLRAHREGRFRFVFLMAAGARERPDRNLIEYARATGWDADIRVAFDARALVRAFAEVLSFSRGLRYDEGGRVGLERTFAGARRVRVLAIHEQGEPRLGLERLSTAGAATPIEAGPTYRSEHGWSFRATTTAPATEPFAVRTSTAGTEVLVVPVYGRLRVEAVIAPCGESPPLPWAEERAVRAGQPACAHARLVADGAETLVPGRSFDFELSFCADPACESPTPMQPGPGGTFQAVLGDLSLGRHERTFRAHGGALAFPVDARRGTAAVAFGVQRVVRSDAPDRAITTLDAGSFPREAPLRVTLRFHGAYPADARATLRCELSGAAAECFRCVPSEPEIALQDPAQVQLELDTTPFCAAASEHGELPLDARLVIEPQGAAASALSAFALPIEGNLRYGALAPIELTLEGGDGAELEAQVPAPRTLEEVHARVELDTSDLEVSATVGRVRAGEDGMAPVRLRAAATECCGAQTYDATLVLGTGESELRLPLKIHVTDPGFWVCPGRLIVRIAAGVFALFFLIWLIRGFLGPARFREGATLLFAESHDHLLSLRDGDDGLRPLARFTETKRGFRRNAALHLGGPRAPLPSLKRIPDAGRIEATSGGGATLIVTAGGVERFTEANGWEELAPGSYPVSNRIQLRRGEELYLELRH